MHQSTAVVASIALLLLAGSGATLAADCTGAIKAEGRAANPKNYDPPRSYDMDKLARARAVEAWQARVRKSCPGSATDWKAAAKTSIECEGYAGGQSCEATGIPARR